MSLMDNVCIWLQLLGGWKDKLKLADGPLPQELFEGVDPDEWVRFNVVFCLALITLEILRYNLSIIHNGIHTLN